MEAGNLETRAPCYGATFAPGFTKPGDVLSFQAERSEDKMAVFSGDLYSSAIQKEKITPGKQWAICKLKLKHNKKESKKGNRESRKLKSCRVEKPAVFKAQTV